jgi:hypothetical protein
MSLLPSTLILFFLYISPHLDVGDLSPWEVVSPAFAYIPTVCLFLPLCPSAVVFCADSWP